MIMWEITMTNVLLSPVQFYTQDVGLHYCCTLHSINKKRPSPSTMSPFLT
jgi:hypothetical protein